jgi:hypothetical protein
VSIGGKRRDACGAGGACGDGTRAGRGRCSGGAGVSHRVARGGSGDRRTAGCEVAGDLDGDGTGSAHFGGANFIGEVGGAGKGAPKIPAPEASVRLVVPVVTLMADSAATATDKVVVPLATNCANA